MATATRRIIDSQQGTGASEIFPANGFNVIRVQVWSASTSVATVLIQVRSDDDNAPWVTAATITNPSLAAPEYWVVPTSGQMRVNVSAWTSGIINANLERYNMWR